MHLSSRLVLFPCHPPETSKMTTPDCHLVVTQHGRMCSGLSYRSACQSRCHAAAADKTGQQAHLMAPLLLAGRPHDDECVVHKMQVH